MHSIRSHWPLHPAGIPGKHHLCASCCPFGPMPQLFGHGGSLGDAASHPAWPSAATQVAASHWRGLGLLQRLQWRSHDAEEASLDAPSGNPFARMGLSSQLFQPWKKAQNNHEVWQPDQEVDRIQPQPAGGMPSPWLVQLAAFRQFGSRGAIVEQACSQFKISCFSLWSNFQSENSKGPGLDCNFSQVAQWCFHPQQGFCSCQQHQCL